MDNLIYQIVLTCRDILKSIVKKLNEKKLIFYETWNKFVSSHACDVCHANLPWNDEDLFQVISQLLAGDEVTVVADGHEDGTADSSFFADGYTSFTGMQIRAGLE